jgi:DNA replication protein DnaC
MPHTATLPLLLKQLRLTSFSRHWEALLEQSTQRGWNGAQYLTALCEQELADRHSRRIGRYAKESQLPLGKTLSSFDFTQVPELKAEQIQVFTTGTDWVHQTHNLLLFGASGVGKTHLAAAIGHGLTEQGIRVRHYTTTALVQSLQQARERLQLEDALQKLDKYRVLILDDFGYVKKSDQETYVLFELIAHRYETGSLIITSNQPFSQWDNIFPDEMMTVAAIDRLVHHANLIEVRSDSYRRKAAMRQMGREQTATLPENTPPPSKASVADGQVDRMPV